MLESYLTQTCDKITISYNGRGDRVFVSAGTYPCRFRNIETVDRITRLEVETSDSMIWLRADTPITRGDIIRFEGAYYEVERVTKARKLGSNTVHFLKCDLNSTQIDVS